MSQVQISSGAAEIGADFTAIAADTAIPRLSVLTPATLTSGRGGVNLCAADGSYPCGLALRGADQGSAVQGKCAGAISGTPEEWDAVITGGTGGGLEPLQGYFVSRVTPGKITATLPTSGQEWAPVGVAISPTTLVLMLSFPTTA